jgi:ABC-type uncharacterized transport system auxiliary subunit
VNITRVTKVGAALAVIVATTLGLTGCSTEARAERKGKQFGDQVCKVRNADSPESAQRHARKASDKLDDLSRFVGRDVRQDVRSADRNIDQMVRDVNAGRNIREQDVNALVRAFQQASNSTTGATRAAYDGVLEGLSNCT